MEKRYRITKDSKILMTKFILCFLGVILGFLWQLNLESQRRINEIYDNVEICGFNLGGKSKDEAKNILQTQYIDNSLKKTINISANDKNFSIELSHLIQGSNLDEVVNSAFTFGKNFNLIEKYKTLTSKNNKKYNLVFTCNEGNLRAFINSIENQVNKTPVNASIIINNNDTIKKDSHGKFIITTETKGYKLDNRKLFTDLKTLVKQGVTENISIKAPVEEIEASITKTMLLNIDTKIASFSTSYQGSPSGRATNIKVATKPINGILLMPDDIFSFNKIVGNRTKENGYFDAKVIVNNKIESGIGGGVCQVSTTLYNAILRTGMRSLERKNHSLPSSYVDIGLDATVSWDHLDYKFKNTLGYPVIIECYTSNAQLYFNVYSNAKLANKTYTIENDVYEVIKPPIQYIYDRTYKETSPKLTGHGSNGYKVRVIRKTYENGLLCNSEVISNDTYKPTPTVYTVGVKK